MSDSASHLPARPSLEQLQKRAKELLKQHRAGEAAAIERFAAASPRRGEAIDRPALSDAQFTIAREYGFESWAHLKQYVEGLQPSRMDHFGQLAAELAAAYTSDDRSAVRPVNRKYGTGFACDFHELVEMHRRLPTWFAAEFQTPELALGDAQQMIARSHGFETWEAFAQSGSRPAADPRSAPVFISQTAPFYTIDWEEGSMAVRGPQSEDDWITIFDVMKEYRIARLDAGALSDDAMMHLTALDHVTELNIEGSILTDEGAAWLARMPQLRHLDFGGWTSLLTDRGLEVLRHLPDLRLVKLCWAQKITDDGLAHLAACEHLEEVNLLGTPAGDGAIRALAGKRSLRQLATGRGVTDTGLALLHELPVFKTWHGGDVKLGLMSERSGPNRLLLDGPFTDAGLANLVGLDGLFGLTFFWHSPDFTSAGLEVLKHLPNLGFLGCQDEHCDDEAMRHIAALPRLRMLMGQGAVATDDGFEALSRSQSIEHIWGRDCPNLGSRGFSALGTMPKLEGLAVSCKNVDDEALSRLPGFPALRGFVPMDVPDAGFRHVGRCENLENLWCMYCRETGDAATEHIAGLRRLKKYYAGMTLITDRSLEILANLASLEEMEFWECMGISDAGAAHLTRLPRLRKISFGGQSGVTREVMRLFPPHTRVTYSG